MDGRVANRRGVQGGALLDSVGDQAVEEDERDLAVQVDLLDVALDHDGTAFAEQALDLAHGGLALAGVDGRVAADVAHAGGHGGLDDELAEGREARVDLVLGQVLLGLQPVRGNRGHAQGGQFLEVVLVRVPVENVRGVLHATQLLRPLQERGAVARVVGHGAHDDHAGLGPVDVGVVPHLDLGVAPARRQLVEQTFLAFEEVGHGLAGH